MSTYFSDVGSLGFELVSLADVATSRPALDRAEWQCERCRRRESLRVCLVKDYIIGDQLIVLCFQCRFPGGVRGIMAARQRAALANRKKLKR